MKTYEMILPENSLVPLNTEYATFGNHIASGNREKLGDFHFHIFSDSKHHEIFWCVFANCGLGEMFKTGQDALNALSDLPNEESDQIFRKVNEIRNADCSDEERSLMMDEYHKEGNETKDLAHVVETRIAYEISRIISEGWNSFGVDGYSFHNYFDLGHDDYNSLWVNFDFDRSIENKWSVRSRVRSVPSNGRRMTVVGNDATIHVDPNMTKLIGGIGYENRVKIISFMQVSQLLFSGTGGIEVNLQAFKEEFKELSKMNLIDFE